MSIMTALPHSSFTLSPHLISFSQRNAMRETPNSHCLRSYLVSLLLRRCIPICDVAAAIADFRFTARGYTESETSGATTPSSIWSFSLYYSHLYRFVLLSSGWMELRFSFMT
jgi:hypothetical protein